VKASVVTRLSLILVGASALAGCAPTVALEPAIEANTPACAQMMVRLPDEVAELPRRMVNAQSTAAWGIPVAVIVRCGLPTPPPSTLPCVTVRGVDWLRDDSAAPSYVFTTFGLNPATEVIIDSEAVSGTAVLQEISRAVQSQSEPVRECLDPTSSVN
jgi:hypothetical protein